MQNFIYTAHPIRVCFGNGVLHNLATEATALGLKNIHILSTPGQRHLAEKASQLLGERASGIYDQAKMHVPVDIVDDAVNVTTLAGADGYVAIGGGSTIGLAKALANKTHLPFIAIPTTYAGSEMTSVYGITREGLKTTAKDPHVLPKTVLYDPELSLKLPYAISATSGLNAIAHAAEGLYAQDINPVSALMAEEGIRALATGLRRLQQSAQDLQARNDCLYGAWLCGTVLANAGMALHHKLCHTLGGSFNLPHADTHAIMLPHSIAYNASATPEAMMRISRALGRPEASAPAALFELLQELRIPNSLKSLGLQEENLEQAAKLAVANAYWNPRPVELDSIRQLLDNAFHGRPPVQ